jgi:GR25 family glycosyltransferase involved in LPS biosynthesis
MRIGLNVNFQHSFFSSGSSTAAFSLAAALKALGHTPVLINLNGISQWYEDVNELNGIYEQINLSEFDKNSPLDLLIDIDGIITPSDRKAISKKTAVFIRKPAFIKLFESTVYPSFQMAQNLHDCDEIWTWDSYDIKDSHLLEILTKKHVARIPFTWCPKAVEAYGKDIPKYSTSEGPWEIHSLETNSTVANNSTFPVVAIAYAHRNSHAKFDKVYIHNSDHIANQQFFKENVLAHCEKPELEYSFVGRIRCSDLRRSSNNVVLSHIRFMTMKNILLDCVWNGIPIIHNSPFLKEIGFKRYYYSDNSVMGVTTAMNNLNEDRISGSGMFTPGFLESIKKQLTEYFDPHRNINAWLKALSSEVKPNKNEFIIGFSDVYDSFNYEYNFWTLLLNEAGKHLTPPVSVRGVDAKKNSAIDLLMFGPFGTTWKDFNCPKVHFTGENPNMSFTGEKPHIDGVLNLGFGKDGPNSLRLPLWMTYIDWFGANQERLINPKTVPIDTVCKPVVCSKEKFCAFVVTNPTNTERNNAFHKLSSYKKVDSAGRLFNNTGDSIFTNIGGGGGGELKKVEFLKDYKFCLTYENGKADGYVTEKLLAAKAAGCIPIYWGADEVNTDFIAGSFINIKDENELISAVEKVDTNLELFNTMSQMPAVDCDKVRKRLSEVARAILGTILDNHRLDSLPKLIGAATTAEAQALGQSRGCLTKSIIDKLKIISSNQNKLGQPNKTHRWNSKTLLVTCATQKYIESLLKWLQTVQQRLDIDSNISARVYLGDDIQDSAIRLLKTQHPKVDFYRLPTELKVAQFPDLWEPQHFAWKLWIYQELVQEEGLQNTLIWYMDAASIIVRWPTEWFQKTIEDGLCMLQDPEQKNDQWCHPVFQKKLMTTVEELNTNQVVGGIMAFVGGSSLPWKVFSEAWVLGQQRDIIVGPKWSGSMPDGRPFGHRHDQSILSILQIRRNVPVYPLYNVYNHDSLRRCYKAGASLYIHRGDFKEHDNFASRIGEVHLINLARRPDRILKFKNNHGSWTKKVCLRPAYDGKELVLSPAMAKVFSPNDFLWKKAIMGCAISHLSLWLELANEQPCCENYLILEDDVKFKEEWLEVWDKASKSIPEDYDVLYLGGILPPNRLMYEKTLEPVNESWSRIAENRIFGQIMPTRYFHFCNYSYILSRKGAQKILEDISAHGYTTSADHMVCNRMDMKHYVLNTLVAGCYQDDDPKYQSSEFNNFNRIDAFDSDLWNNDDRFSEHEIKVAIKNPINSISLEQVIIDGRIKKGRIYTVGTHRLVNGSLLEYEWLNGLLEGGLDNQKQLPVDHEPLDSKPIFICMKPHFDDYLKVFKRYKMAGKEFYAIHLSDEHSSDPIEWYKSCKHVFRPYVRHDTADMANVTHIPLGYYRSTKLTRELKERKLIWSFFGTGWSEREKKMEQIKYIEPNSYNFYNNWMDSKQLSHKEYSEMCLNSVFMPCPPGQNVETFRFYEALEHGVVPIYIYGGEDDLHFKLLAKHLPLVVLDSWDSVKNAIIVFLQKPELLNEYRSKILIAWADWKIELKKTFSALV